jgi:hypothetical protein
MERMDGVGTPRLCCLVARHKRAHAAGLGLPRSPPARPPSLTLTRAGGFRLAAVRGRWPASRALMAAGRGGGGGRWPVWLWLAAGRDTPGAGV